MHDFSQRHFGHDGLQVAARRVIRKTRPRRPDMSLVMSPTLLLGTVIWIFTIGSKRPGLACWKTLR